jgi:hypothetical protein
MTEQTTTAPPVDVDALARQVREHEARERRQAEATRLAREVTGGPCVYCGTTLSAYREPGRRGTVRGVWFTAPGGKACSACDLERRGGRYADAPLLPPEQHRARVLYRLLPELDRRWLPQHAVPRSGFRWWHETPGARPAPPPGDQRFAYLDLDALRAALAPAPAPLETREPCLRCGLADRWRSREVQRGWVYADTGASHPANPLRIETVWECAACASLPESLDELAARLVGLNPQPGLAAQLGLTWHADRPPERVRLLARVRPSPATPFAWWPPRQQLQARAWALYGPQPGEWERQAERRWHSLAAMRSARQAAGQVSA